MYQDPNYGANFTITIGNMKQMYYARNLLDIYLNLIKPFLDENKEVLGNFSSDFKRFHYFRHPLANPGYGKSFTNLDTAVYSGPHGPPHALGTSDYYLSHFRRISIFPKIHAPIDSVVFDFNYFFCYFQPIFEKLKRNI